MKLPNVMSFDEIVEGYFRLTKEDKTLFEIQATASINALNEIRNRAPVKEPVGLNLIGRYAGWCEFKQIKTGSVHNEH